MAKRKTEEPTNEEIVQKQMGIESIPFDDTTIEPHTGESIPPIDPKEKVIKENELILKKQDKEEEVRLAELDVKRMYESAGTLFKNASDYIKHKIVPVHSKEEHLVAYSYLLEKWLNVLEIWAEGIPMGRAVDWDVIDEMLKDIKKETIKLSSEQEKVKVDKINSRIEELKKINDEIAALNQT